MKTKMFPKAAKAAVPMPSKVKSAAPLVGSPFKKMVTKDVKKPTTMSGIKASAAPKSLAKAKI